jgi:hypothetical protein
MWTHDLLMSALVGGEWSASRPCHFTPEEIASDIHWIGWMDLTAGLDVVEKFLILPELELRPLGRLSRSQSLYRLFYRGSTAKEAIRMSFKMSGD